MQAPSLCLSAKSPLPPCRHCRCRHFHCRCCKCECNHHVSWRYTRHCHWPQCQREKSERHFCSFWSGRRTAELRHFCRSATHHPIELGLQCQFGWGVWCHPLGQHQYHHPIKLRLQCRFGWWVWCHPLGQHQYHHRYLGIQPCPKEEGQLFDAVPLLREY